MPRILVDNNLSVLLKEVLQYEFPGSTHVNDIGMADASDTEIWEYGKKHFDAIITKDRDFYFRVTLYGPPPKVIWITSGNMRNKDFLDLIREKKEIIRAFLLSNHDILNIQKN